jgi:RNA polymerase sigma-70 factor, ECF subfamily
VRSACYLRSMEAYERGRAAWPTVNLDPVTFAAHLERLAADGQHAEDLYLACACAAGDPAALALFEQRFIAEVPLFIARIDPSPAVADETKQALREYLLVAAAGARPRIADYAGRGSLGGWIRVIATRRVVQQRRPSVGSNEDAAHRLAATEPNPEVALIRKRYGAELAAALGAAIASLSDRDRGLLKLAIIDELSMDELCGLYSVHRTTLWRWLVQLKQRVLDEALGILRRKLALETAELESLCRSVQSQLDFSLGGLLDNG